jgi:tRNA dimethylallyltransferase
MDSCKKIKLLAITGPTASGKTALAIALARELDGEIISCDSMQIYREMDIGTAKPTAEELSAVRHHLIDLLPPDAPYSCADYVRDAEAAIRDIHSRGKLPILCGGTGLYLDRLLRGGVDGEASCNEKVRERLMSELRELGRDAMYERLCAIDPEAAAAIHKNNEKRVLRALEICEVTGRKKSEIDKENSAFSPLYDATVISLVFHNRELLYERIERRVDQMIQQGLVDQARALMNAGVFERSQTAAQAIGYKELFPYLNGERGLEECVNELKIATRRYAKRQLTWFGGKDYVKKLFVDDDNGLKTFEDIVNISKKLF